MPSPHQHPLPGLLTAALFIADAATLPGTLIYMLVGSAPVAFKDSLSLGTVVTAVQEVPLSAQGCAPHN